MNVVNYATTNIFSHILNKKWQEEIKQCKDFFSASAKGEILIHYWAATCEIPCELDVKCQTCEIYHVILMM